MLDGIDVSKWQDIRDWNEVANFAKFVWMRSSLGLSTDSKLEEHYQSAKGLLPIGFYYVPRDVKYEPANKQLAHLIYLSKTYPTELPLALDCERQDHGFSLVEYLAKGYKEEFGRYPVIYTSPGWWNHRWQSLPAREQDTYWMTFSKCDLWTAHYGAAIPMNVIPWGQPMIHQYSQTGQVNGIKNNVDLNHFFGTQEEFNIRYLGHVPPPNEYKYAEIRDFATYPRISFLLFRSEPNFYESNEIFALGAGAKLEIAGEKIITDNEWLPVFSPKRYGTFVGYISAKDKYVKYLKG